MSEVKLFYRGTDIEIRLGDYISYKPIFKKRINGRVSYMPGESEPNEEMESSDEKKWAILLDSGMVVSWLFLPGDLEASKRLEFIKRSDDDYSGFKKDDVILGEIEE